MLKYRNTLLWITWILITIGLTAYLVVKINDKASNKSIFLPGETSHGHHQIELACESCHSKSFADGEAIQESCMNCHGAALSIAKDKHPKSKFTDPRNADRVEILDARYCVTCHVEHRPEITHDMGLTLPTDYCQLCHKDIADDRPSHTGMEFNTCASSGCHNYHDNQALYEDYLIKHLHKPDLLERRGSLPELNLKDVAPVIPGYPIDTYPLKELAMNDRDVPEQIKFDKDITREWFETTHSKSGVNCTACHQKTDSKEKVWIEKPNHKVCKTCHTEEVNNFMMGKHGMRLDEEKLKRTLSPMSPAMARLAMKKDVMNKQLTCNTCHAAHKYDVVKAKVEQCLTCHNDDHSLAYIDSPHHQLWQKEINGVLPKESGVTCATCHMPRIEKDYFDGEFYQGLVQHNQNDTLKPNEKMIRPVCMNCHSLSFSIDSLADKALIKNNFSSKPSLHIESMEMAEKRMIEAEAKKKEIRERNKILN